MGNAYSSQDQLYPSLPKERIWEDLFLYQFNGFWFLPLHLQGVEKVVNEFKPLHSDVILASFPKTGTTWLKSLLFSILYRSSKQSLITSHPHDLVPSLEQTLYAPYSPPKFPVEISSFSRRLLSTHIPFQLLAENLNSSDCRVVYISRNPKDTIVSMWHFVNKRSNGKRDPWPLEVAVEKYCGGDIFFGPYYDHVIGYHKVSLERPNKVFFITYEELKNDPKTHVKRLGEFLGCPFDTEEEAEEIVRSCSFEVLKNHEVNKLSADWHGRLRAPNNSFFRKGEVGDYQNYLRKEMIELIDKTTIEKFRGSSFDVVEKDYISKQCKAA